MPFTIEEFLNVFQQYNLSVWPVQLFLYALAAITVGLVFIKHQKADKIINSILSFFWLWMGIVYHLIHFSPINKAAYLFGTVFIIQGIIFLYFGVFRSDTLSYRFKSDFPGMLGITFIFFALIIYPILAYALGHVYPKTPTFGLPCPTTIFTFGILLFTVKKIPWYLIIIPLLWSLIGFSAAMQLSIEEDFGLVVAGIAGTITLLFFKPKQHALA